MKRITLLNVRGVVIYVAIFSFFTSCKKLDLERTNSYDEESNAYVKPFDRLVIEGFISSTINGDKKVSAGEDFTLTLRVFNSGETNFENLNLEVSNVEELWPALEKDTITVNSKDSEQVSYKLYLHAQQLERKGASSLNFVVKLSDGESSITDTITIPIHKLNATFSITDVKNISDLSPCNDGFSEITIRNNGPDVLRDYFSLRIEPVTHPEYLDFIYYDRIDQFDHENGLFEINETSRFKIGVRSECTLPKGITITFNVHLHDQFSRSVFYVGQFSKKSN